MKKSILLAGVIFLLAAACNTQPAQEQPQNSVNTSTQSNTRVYSNDQYDFQFTHPVSWRADGGERGIILTFQTRDGHQVELLLDTFQPTQLSDPFQTKKPVRIGSEDGLRDASYNCGDGSDSDATCTAVLIYQTPRMLAKGFDLEFHILNINRSLRTGAAANDPTALFPEDVKDIESVLATFELMN